MNNRGPPPSICVDAFEYGVMLRRAYDELNWGTDIRKAIEAADALTTVSPGNALVYLLRAKAERMAWNRRKLERLQRKGSLSALPLHLR